MGATESPARKRRRDDSPDRYSSRDRGREHSREHDRELGSHKGRAADGSTHRKHDGYDRSDRRDRPSAHQSGRPREHSSRGERQQDEHLNGSGREHDRTHERHREPHRHRDRSREHHRGKEPQEDRPGDSHQQRGGERELHREQDRPQGRARDREQDRLRDRPRDRERDREQHREQDRPRDREQDRPRDREQHREQDRPRDRERDRPRNREQDRLRDREQDREGEREGAGRQGKGTRQFADKGDSSPPARRAVHHDGRGDRGDPAPASRGDHERSRHHDAGQDRDRLGPAAAPHRHGQQQRDTRGTDSRQQQQHHHHQRQRHAQEPEPDGKPKWGKPGEDADAAPAPTAPKEGPNLGLSGKLAAETNKTADGTAELKFQAPAEARVCKKPVWKLFVYKGQDMVGEPITLTQLPFYMFGKDRKVADIPTDHPSCSRQHAVLVFREVEKDAPDGIGYVRVVKPYVLDLETTNGTTVNKERLEPARYYELLHTDVLRFGFSSREYVVMNTAEVP